MRSSSGTFQGSVLIGVCQNVSYALTGASLHVELLRHRAGLRHVGRDADDALDLVGRHDRTARKAPHAAMNHADAKAVGVLIAKLAETRCCPGVVSRPFRTAMPFERFSVKRMSA